MEAWGRGVPLILANAPDVTFREVAGLFIASFARPSARHAGAESAPSKTTSKTTPKTTPKTAPEQQVRRRQKTGETLLQILRQQPHLSTSELAQMTGLSQDGIKYNINQLKRTGKLVRHGPAKGGYWEVTDKSGDE